MTVLKICVKQLKPVEHFAFVSSAIDNATGKSLYSNIKFSLCSYHLYVVRDVHIVR